MAHEHLNSGFFASQQPRAPELVKRESPELPHALKLPKFAVSSHIQHQVAGGAYAPGIAYGALAAPSAVLPFTMPTLFDPGSQDDDDIEESDEFGDCSRPSTSIAMKRDDRVVRRRSSKACDGCRKSKCKCERVSSDSACKNCEMLGAPCTFLGPSRKRGPPKGYIDALEARMHQAEALLGVLIGSGDERALTLFADLAHDSLAAEIIARVDGSPYGATGRRRGAELPTKRQSSRTSPAHEPPPPGATHPTTEWQDHLIARLRHVSLSRGRDPVTRGGQGLAARAASADGRRHAPQSPVRHVRRRVDASGAYVPVVDMKAPWARPAGTGVSAPASTGRLSPQSFSQSSTSPVSRQESLSPAVVSPISGAGVPVPSAQLAAALCQLSMNEERQLRYHGPASGLQLLAARGLHADAVHRDGLWRFPDTMSSSPLDAGSPGSDLSDLSEVLPDRATQEKLLEVYWAHVHPVVPVVDKGLFMEAFEAGRLVADEATTPQTPDGPRVISNVLLLSMFAAASRHTSLNGPAYVNGSPWNAGNAFTSAVHALNCAPREPPSRISSVQSLLLLGYRSLGLGSSARGWLFIGAAIRIAQDLGMHRAGVHLAAAGGTLFGVRELEERARVWHVCVALDAYASTYIGRPLAIGLRDFDIALPAAEGPEETDHWRPADAPLPPASEADRSSKVQETGPGRVLSCFSASSELSVILGRMLQTLYAVRPPADHESVEKQLESTLEKWMADLPAGLKLDEANGPQPPHVLDLHMQYWTIVLLLHRPTARRPSLDEQLDPAERDANQKYASCLHAANRISSIVGLYERTWGLERTSVFPTYYVFTAGITHLDALSVDAGDVQARAGLDTCLSALRKMGIAWPHALRCCKLLEGTRLAPLPVPPRPLRVTIPDGSSSISQSRKRSLDRLEDEDVRAYAPPSTAPASSSTFSADYFGAESAYDRIPSSDTLARLGLDTSFGPQTLLAQSAVNAQAAFASVHYAQPTAFERWAATDASTSPAAHAGLNPDAYLGNQGSGRIVPPSLMQYSTAGEYQEHDAHRTAPDMHLELSTLGVQTRFPQYFADYSSAPYSGTHLSYAQQASAHHATSAQHTPMDERVRHHHSPQAVSQAGTPYMFLAQHENPYNM